MSDDTTISVFEAIRALAFIGDLSMGQPTDHSLRTAWLAGLIAQAAGCDASQVEAARHVALLRWSGCIANAHELSAFLDDDVRGRKALLELPKAPMHQVRRGVPLPDNLLSIAMIHCEVAGDIANMLDLGSEAEAALRSVFETYDGGGVPGVSRGADVPLATCIVALASDLEIFSRLYRLEEALAIARERANSVYPAFLVEASISPAVGWMAELDTPAEPWASAAGQPAAMQRRVDLELVANVVDLKLPWMTGYSRRVAVLARDCAVGMGLEPYLCQRAYRAGLIHGMGRASVPNAIWNAPEPLPASSLERIRLVPYWTARAARHIQGLAHEAELASFAFERRDGSGYFRGLSGAAMPLEAQIIAAAEQWVSHRTPRPWRPAFTETESLDRMRRDVDAGRFDRAVVATVAACMLRSGHVHSPLPQQGDQPLSLRELEVLRRISHGDSTKDVARALDISPRTVRTHVERLFVKLGCSTRAAATLKASARGWL